jgi:hypothetical protein
MPEGNPNFGYSLSKALEFSTSEEDNLIFSMFIGNGLFYLVTFRKGILLLHTSELLLIEEE